ncbi:MAG: DNA-directed RNA polymerase subunit omega [Desulfobulbaceae bacterium]|nr:DNA-directed RNA polymerase subunit omega [Desulfobulbaceae bacterium]
MARITVEDCLARIGDQNRFSLIHLAMTRVKQHRKGQPVLTKGKNKEIVMSLREIAAGEVSFDNIKELQGPARKRATETVQEAEETATTETNEE